MCALSALDLFLFAVHFGIDGIEQDKDGLLRHELFFSKLILHLLHSISHYPGAVPHPFRGGQ
jgi:hypothetical protein